MEMRPADRAAPRQKARRAMPDRDLGWPGKKGSMWARWAGRLGADGRDETREKEEEEEEEGGPGGTGGEGPLCRRRGLSGDSSMMASMSKYIKVGTPGWIFRILLSSNSGVYAYMCVSYLLADVVVSLFFLCVLLWFVSIPGRVLFSPRLFFLHQRKNPMHNI